RRRNVWNLGNDWNVRRGQLGRHEARLSFARTETVCGSGEGSEAINGVVSQRSRSVEDCGIRRVEFETVWQCGERSREGRCVTAANETVRSKHGKRARAGIRAGREVRTSAALFDCGDEERRQQA